MVGDPSGRTGHAPMMTVENHTAHNCACFKKQMGSFFIEFGDGKAQMVNNADWLMDPELCGAAPARWAPSSA